MKRNFLILLGALAAFLFAMSAGAADYSVTADMAKSAADAWVARNAAFGVVGSATSVETVCDTNASKTVLWHQVAMSGGGMLVVAPSQDVEPVLAAVDGTSLAPALRAMLLRDMRRRLRALGLYDAAAASSSSPSASSTAAASSRALRTASSASSSSASSASRSADMEDWAQAQRAKWSKLGVGSSSSSLRAARAAVPGLDDVDVQIGVVDGFEKNGRFTHWNQNKSGGEPCYDFYTPGNAPCGCVATACAAVMQYFSVTGPVEKISGLCSYNGVWSEYEAVGGVYDWSILPASFGGEGSGSSLDESQRELLGRVAYDVGVGLGMAWTDGESGAAMSDIAGFFKDSYGFKDARHVSYPSQAQISKLVYNQCRAGAPVLLGIAAEDSDGGHAVVAVGYGLDSDGVERTRVFLGWGGVGDAWYALPDISTSSAPDSGVNDYDVVDEIVTMIGYDSDEVVPVVGQLTGRDEVADLPITVRGVVDTNGDVRVVSSDANGYFATRVSPLVANGVLECCGKLATYTIGEDAIASENASENAAVLAPALPDPIDFVIMNASVAYSMESAIEMALAENKAILRVSGTRGEAKTDAVVDYVYELDSGNVDGFSDKYVYFFSSCDSDDPSGPDGNPSFGVFLPQVAAADGRWSADNGRLSYGYVNVEDSGVVVFTDLVSTNYYEVVEADDDDGVAIAALDCFDDVLAAGWDSYSRCVSGIALSVTAFPSAAGTVSPAYGVHSGVFTNGEEVVAVCPAELTNAENTVVMACRGWTLTNATTGAFSKGKGTTTTFTLSDGDVCVLTWQLETNLVYVAVNVSDDGKWGSVTPASGWFPYGEVAVFTAVPQSNGAFNSFSAGLPADAAVAGYSAAWAVCEPVVLNANFARGVDTAVYASTNTLFVRSWLLAEDGYYTLASESGAAVPACRVAGAKGMDDMTIADGASASVPATELIVAPVATSFTDADGVEWQVSDAGYAAGDAIGGTSYRTTCPAALVDVSDSDMTVNFFWEPVVAGADEGDDDDPSGGDDPSAEPEAPAGSAGASPLTIVANADGTFTVKADVANAAAGWWYTLYAADSLDGTWRRASAVETGLADGGIDAVKATGTDVSLSITLTPQTASRFYKVVVTKDPPSE